MLRVPRGNVGTFLIETFAGINFHERQGTKIILRGYKHSQIHGISPEFPYFDPPFQRNYRQYFANGKESAFLRVHTFENVRNFRKSTDVSTCEMSKQSSAK